ncbi:inactive tyrosine-protein kinase PRAG1 isoform X1 [Myotis myotis]|uniref:PEAK1 related, kinase-activating pseudokinase 1 n=2 Tax=Myotis myotis TaxID=51298 RepID=A0A7J7Z8A7_MYOMY|nr:inactive tyrosine-protein kinase PRAG1 isoform X1 [Myotis myotis]XP_036154370.1 inactive tyrosine-protein kinase PRAG1 isoform X1 [Myotis myotis]XP_036154371.1 inactive tyrosine-protein kinase PRAG1 isoform X1 [Myotis myotis]XP_036154372.1 inactive tyrosine-protein kinase PRAG1 isoform X1 [Myotis myotis]KAF6370176.1 PEAK1 related, kinase-activating pseudokinase 1 [Myotis myotis]
MSACSDFVEHIWKPGSCKNCFCLRGDHQLSPTCPQPRAGGLPPPRLPPRPEHCRLEDEGVNSSPYSKPTIAVKPTMLSSDASDVCTEANMSPNASQDIWRWAPSKLPFPKQEDAPMVCLGSFRGVQKPAVPAAPADGHPRCPPVYAMVGLHSPGARGERSTAFHPLNFPEEKAGREEKPMFPHQELTSAQESRHRKLAGVGSRTAPGCAKDPGTHPSPQPPRESLPSEDDSDQRCSPSGDSEGGEYCSILDCCPRSPAAKDTSQGEGPRHRPGGGDRSPTCWEQGTCGGPAGDLKQVLGFPRECCGQGPSDHPPHPGPRKLSPPSEAASSSDGLSCGSASSGASSPCVPHLESDYCSLVKEPVPGKQQDSSCHGVASNRCLGPTGEPQPPTHPREAVQPEPIYAESTKRKKAVPVPSRPQGKAEQPAAGPGQGRMVSTWTQKTASGGSRDREGPDVGPKVAATITIMAASPKEDHRTIYLSSPDSAVGVQWLRPLVGQDSGAGDQETSAGQGKGSREGHHHASSQNVPKGRPAIPPKLSKGSPGGSPVSPSPSPLSDLSEGSSGGSTGPQPSSRCPANPASSCRANGVANHDSAKCPPPATTASAADQRRPRYQTGAWSRQCRIEEEEEVEQNLLSQSWGGETMAKGTKDPSSSSTWHHLCPTDGASGQNDKAGTGMSKSASFAFEFPKDRHGIETFSPPPPPPKSRHLLKMNKSSSDLEKVSQGSAESLSPSFRSVHVSFTTGSTDSLASDSRTGSDGGPSSEPPHSPTNSGKKLFAPVPFPSGSTEDVSRSSPLQPPPLPQKKLVSRAASSPDGFLWTQGSPKPRAASPKLNLSHSEINVRAHEESHFGHGNRHHHAFSSEPLEKTFKGNGHWVPAPGLAGGRSGSGSPSLQCKGVPSASSSQLSVASQASTSSNQLQLHSLLSSISSKEGTHAKLVGLYAQSLIRLGAKCEDLFMGRQKKELHFNENNWSLFKLTCNKPCCDSGDAIYYCATCSEDPGSTYAVKICKTPEPKVASYCSPAVPVHFNIQQDCGHFVASVPSSMLASPDAPKDPAPAPPAPPPAQEQDCVVVITREVPHQTASDFVRDSVGSHRSEPEAYERRVCFLLLQLCNGLEHLKEHRVIHRDLCLENLLLVHCAPQASPAPPASSASASAPPSAACTAPAAGPAPGPSTALPASVTPSPPTAPTCEGVPSEKHLPRLIISNFLKAKQKPGGTANLQQKKSQARLAPEIVSASQYSKFDEFQTGILIYELLHQPNPFEVRAQLWEQDYRREDLPPLPTLSLYSPGLQQLAHLLLEADPIKRIRIGEAKRVLQCLLWGPRRELVEQRGTSEEALSSALHNWIDMKRALMMLKFAEKAVDRRRGVELEDWLCCQYLASAEPSALLQSLKLLQLL